MAGRNDCKFYSAKEAANILGVHLWTIYNYARIKPDKGGPPVTRLRNKILRFPKTAFNKWAGIE